MESCSNSESLLFGNNLDLLQLQNNPQFSQRQIQQKRPQEEIEEDIKLFIKKRKNDRNSAEKRDEKLKNRKRKRQSNDDVLVKKGAKLSSNPSESNQVTEEITCNGVPMIKEENESDSKTNEDKSRFVCLQKEKEEDGESDDSDLLDYRKRSDNSDSEVSDGDGAIDDEDDSNDENNWRNEYPDEDECYEKDEDDDISQFGDLNIGADYKEEGSYNCASSDDENDGFYDEPTFSLREPEFDDDDESTNTTNHFAIRPSRKIELSNEVVSSESDSELDQLD